MKRTLLILALLAGLPLSAQIRIDDFKTAPDGPRALCLDPDGDPCATLKIETGLSGWTFDTGLLGIMDTRYENGAVYLYVPKGTRKLTVAHKQYGVLRDWAFPVSIEAGRLYTMKLSCDTPAAKPSEARPGKSFCDHFIDMYMGFHGNEEGGVELYSLGLSYTWIGHRVGPYVSAGMNFNESASFLAGGAFRITDPKSASLDWQVYGGAGLIEGSAGFDVGMRFAWRTRSKVSKADFGVGCQFYRGGFMPTVSVGLYIWGVPVLLGVGLACSAI